jgi:RNA polymerase sigma-70 factor (ECF subfamily)
MTTREELEGRKDWKAQLYQRYHQKVFGICLYFLKDREEAKDASHDVFIKVFRAWGEFKWECDPMTWIGAIAKHDCFSRMQKHRKRLDRREQLAREEELRAEPEAGDDLVLHRMRLERCLPLVKGKMRDILRLSLEQGLNHREIAARMGVSRVAITRRLTRLKKSLLDSMEGRNTVAPSVGRRRSPAGQPGYAGRGITTSREPGRGLSEKVVSMLELEERLQAA